LTPVRDALTVQLEYLIIKQVKNGSNLCLTQMTPVRDALTVQLEYLIIKQVKNGSNLCLTQITLWVSGLSGSVVLTRLQC